MAKVLAVLSAIGLKSILVNFGHSFHRKSKRGHLLEREHLLE